jgi:transposase
MKFRLVARTYKAAEGKREVIAAVADTLGVAPATAKNYIGQARKAGLLPPAPPGRKPPKKEAGEWTEQLRDYGNGDGATGLLMTAGEWADRLEAGDGGVADDATGTAALYIGTGYQLAIRDLRALGES